MAIYLICFFASLLFLWAAGKVPVYSATHKSLVVISLIIPLLLAGLRGQTIGTDVLIYVKPLFVAACNSTTFLDYYNASWVNLDMAGGYAFTYDYEPGFILMVYVVANCFHSLNVVLVSIHLFITLFVFAGLAHYQDKFPVWLGMAVFYFMNFNTTLNMMRQWMAMSVIFFGIYYMRKKPVKYLLLVIFGGMFHKSAFLYGILILITDKFVMWKKTHVIHTDERMSLPEKGTYVFTYEELHLFMLAIVILLVFAFMPTLKPVFRFLGLQKYIRYINGSITLMPNQLIIRLPAFFLLFCGYRAFRERSEIAYFLIAMSIFDVLLSQLAGISTYSVRITAYFSMFYMLTLPMVCTGYESKLYRYQMITLLLGYLLFYWVFFYVYKGSSQTVPYVTFWNV